MSEAQQITSTTPTPTLTPTPTPALSGSSGGSADLLQKQPNLITQTPTPLNTTKRVGASNTIAPAVPPSSSGSSPWPPPRADRAPPSSGAYASSTASAAMAGASSAVTPAPHNGWGFDRQRDGRERDAALRGAEQSGWAAPKQPSYTNQPQRGHQNGSDDGPAMRKGWPNRDRDRDRDPRFDDPEGDDRVPRKRVRTDSPPASPPSGPTTIAGAASIAGGNPFISGNAKLAEDMAKKFGSRAAADQAMKRQREEAAAAAAAAPKSLGGKRAKFTPPYRKVPGEEPEAGPSSSSGAPNASVSGDGMSPMLRAALAGPGGKEGEVHEKLRGLDPKLIEAIMGEMLESPGVAWSDIAGLEFAKRSVREIVVWPILRPDMFTGLRGPPKGLLLFGPPGTGKGEKEDQTLKAEKRELHCLCRH